MFRSYLKSPGNMLSYKLLYIFFAEIFFTFSHISAKKEIITYTAGDKYFLNTINLFTFFIQIQSGVYDHTQDSRITMDKGTKGGNILHR